MTEADKSGLTGFVLRVSRWISGLDRVAMTVLRIGVLIVLLWIGGLKWFKYEADGIVPFVATSPLMRWMIKDPEHYKAHVNAEGVLNEANRAWHEANGTYSMAIFVGVCIILIAVFIALHWVRPELGMLGALALIGFTCVTLSFLITTPQVWVTAPAQGAADADLGLPFLSGRGRLVLKDCIQMGAGLVLLVDSARMVLKRRNA